MLLVNLADEWFAFLPAGAMESIRADLGLSYAQAGVLLALLPAGGVLGIFLMAAADFVSRRLLGAAGALVYALCLLTFATGRSFMVLAIAVAAVGGCKRRVRPCDPARAGRAGGRRAGRDVGAHERPRIGR